MSVSISTISTIRRDARLSASLAVIAACLAAPAFAQDAPVQLGPVTVQDKAAGYKAESSSPKYTAPLRDTPQTVTVITKELIADQNLLNLRDVLANTVPGITFSAGEGGGGYGDGINLRGYSATSDITVDGVRDSAQYTRSDPFNIEQIEVVNGANSVYSGAGSVGGGINLVSKVPVGRDNATFTAGGGTDDYGRLTVDAEHAIDDGVSVRLNAMLHNNNAPGRDVEKFSRYGFAPSIAVGLGSPTTFTLAYFFQHDDNIPQYGVPFFLNAFNNGPVPGASRSNYYGYDNIDRQKINSHVVTGIATHQFSDNLSIRNLSRYSRVTQFTTVDPPQGTWCLANGTNVSTGAACASPGTYAPSGPRGNLRDSLNTTLYNQTDLTWHGFTGPLEHNLVFGASFLSETFALTSGNVERTATGAAPAYPLMSIANPLHTYAGPVNFMKSGDQDGARETQSAYVFDNIKLLPQLSLNGGLRYDHNQGRNTAGTYTNNVFVSQGAVFRNEDDLLSYRAGLVYKPAEEASIYIAYGNSRTPSQSAVNGSCAANTCNVRPESAVNYEVGAKWDVLEGLSLSAALFRNERSNYKVPSGDPTIPDQVLDGASRVDGFSFSAAGTILPDWQVFASYTFLDSKVVQSVSDFCVANPALASCAITGSTPVAGNPLTNTPKHAGNLWTTYRVWPGVTAGYGITVQGGYLFNNGVGVLYKGGSYVTHRLMVSYDATDAINLQVNVNNLFDKTYFTRGRNNGWATPGDGRNVTFTASYRM